MSIQPVVCIVLIIVSSVQISRGQIELKSNLFGMVADHSFELFAEIPVNQKMGLEFGGGMEFKEFKEYEAFRFIVTGVYQTNHFNENYVTFSSLLKIYLTQSQTRQGFYYGPRVEGRWRLDEDESYLEWSREVIGRELDRPSLQFSLGAVAGYKKVFWRRFLVEVFGGLAIDADFLFEGGFHGPDTHLSVAAGYQF